MIFFFYTVCVTLLAKVISQECPSPPMIFLKTLLPGQTRVGSVRTYECPQGYQAVGDPTIRCQADLKWTNLQLDCKSCPAPAEEYGCGRLSPQGSNTLHAKREYQCKPGTAAPRVLTIACLPGPDGPTWTVPTQKCAGCMSPLSSDRSKPTIAYLCESGLVVIEKGTVSCVELDGLVVWIKNVQDCPPPIKTIKRVARRLPVDYCKNSPCLNGGICTSTTSGFQCECRNGHIGERCEEMWTFSG